MAKSANKPAKGFRFRTNPKSVDFAGISDVVEAAGMRKRSAAQMRRALVGSSDVVVAYAGQDIVGFGRMISDRVYYGTIWDLAVTPCKQRLGIGTEILKRLLDRAKSRKLYMVGLFTARRNRAFYERLGFTFFDDVHAMTLTQGRL